MPGASGRMTFEEAYRTVEETLRPSGFDEFVGQAKVKENLGIAVKAARRRKEALPHVLFTGLPGLGKTTLARIMAREMGTDLVTTAGPVLKRPGELAQTLTKLRAGDILFIDEIHRIAADVEEFLYSAMEDWFINIPLEKGMNARTLNLKLERFTLIGATTREGMLSEPFISRFVILEKLDYYPVDEMARIVERSAKLLKVGVEADAAAIVAARARGTPRIANRYLFRLRDLAQVRGKGVITSPVAEEGFKMLGVDGEGLEQTHRKILDALVTQNGAVGLKTIAASVGEELDTIEDVYEPYLIRKGFIVKTPKGRRATEKAVKLVKGAVDGQPSLF